MIGVCFTVHPATCILAARCLAHYFHWMHTNTVHQGKCSNVEWHYDLGKSIKFPLINFPSCFFNVACGWLSVFSVGLSSTTIIRKLVTFYQKKTLKKIRMKGWVWCHLSFSSGRKQVCLKYFARLFHTLMLPPLDVLCDRVVFWRKPSSVQTAEGPAGLATKLCCDELFLFFKPNDCEVIIFYFRNNLETWIEIFIQGHVNVSVTFNHVISFF